MLRHQKKEDNNTVIGKCRLEKIYPFRFAGVIHLKCMTFEHLVNVSSDEIYNRKLFDNTNGRTLYSPSDLLLCKVYVHVGASSPRQEEITAKRRRRKGILLFLAMCQSAAGKIYIYI